MDSDSLVEVGDMKDDSSPIFEEDESSLIFEDSELISTSKENLWSVISDPKKVVEFVPGAASITRESKRRYTGEIERGISHLTLTLSGEVELVEMNEPDWIIAEGNVYDSKTHSNFDILAGMEIVEVENEVVRLAYTINIPFTGGVKSLSRPIIRSLIASDIEDYFNNLKKAVEKDDRA